MPIPSLPGAGTPTQEPEAAAPIFAALGDPTRLRLVTRLCQEGPLSISRLTEGVPVTRQAITKHLRALADVGLVRDHRSGREHIWELEPRPLDQARVFLDKVSARWDAALDRLRAFVEEDEEVVSEKPVVAGPEKSDPESREPQSA